MQSLCRLAFLDLRNEVWHGREEHVHPLHACLYGQGCRYMYLSRTGISIKDDISVLMYEVQRFQPWQQVLDSIRQLVPVQLLQTGTLLS